MAGLAELPPAALMALASALGAVVGSFLNVVIHRLPRGESLVRPGSHCPGCGQMIRAWANIPLLSYMVLRGRCSACQARISVRYPLVEGITAVLYLALFLRWGAVPILPVYWLLASALVAITFIDFDHQIIPNAITYPGIALGLVLALTLSAAPSILEAGVAVIGVGGMMWAVAAAYEWRTGRMGLGMGDVKLMAMLGAFLGLEPTLGILILGSLLGLVQGLSLMALRKAGRRTRIPFGPALALAAIIHLFDPAVVMRWMVRL